MKIPLKSSIASKIASGFFILAAIIIINTVISYNQLSSIDRMISLDLMNRANTRSLNKDIIIKSEYVMQLLIGRYLNERDPEQKAAARLIISDEIRIMNEFMNQISKMIQTEEEKEILGNLNRIFADYQDLLNHVFETGTSIDEFMNVSSHFITIMLQMDGIETDLMYESWETSKKQILKIKIYTAAFNIIAMTLGIFLGFIGIRSMLRPISKLVNVLAEYGSGNLRIRADIESDNEIGFFAKKFNLMLEHINVYANNLEEQVTQRTADLEKTNNELQETMTMLKETQDDLIRQEKMAALGDMVAGVAHEINTPVGVALTASTFLSKSVSEMDDHLKKGILTKTELEKNIETLTESSKIITANMYRASELVQGFKQVAVDQSTEEKRIFNVKKYLQEVLLSLHPKTKKTRIAITVECDDNIEIDSYPGSFSQIFTNLISNTIIHAYEPGEEGSIRIIIKTENGFLLLWYLDAGKGIDQDNIHKIFEPFFTTNRTNGGTGLGLHIVYNIVTQKLCGSISVKSRPGQGTEFDIKIPIS